jgi:hypothetical protein
MTNLEWGGYSRTGGNQGGSLLIAYTEAAPVIDAAWIEDRNPAYFSARVERNEARTKALKDASECLKDCDTFTRAAVAINQIKAYRAQLAELIGYGGPLHEIRFEITKLLKEGDL